MDGRGVLLIVCCSVLQSPASVIAITASPGPTTNNTNASETTSPLSSSPTTATSRSSDCDGDSGVGRGIGIGIGIMLLIIAVVVAPLVYFLWRRGWTLPCNTDLLNKQPGHDSTIGTVKPVRAKNMYTRPTTSQEGNKPSEGKGGATTGNKGRQSDGTKSSNKHLDLQKMDSGDVYEDPDKSSAPASARPPPSRPQPERPLSDVYVDTETPPDAVDLDEDYEAPVASSKGGSADVVRLPERVAPEGKGRPSLHDDDEGEIYENTNPETPPPSRPSKGRETIKDKKSSSGPPEGTMDDIYIDMEGGGNVESVYMNTE